MSASSTGRGSGLAARRSRLAPRLIPACRVQTAEYAVPTLEERPNARPVIGAAQSDLVIRLNQAFLLFLFFAFFLLFLTLALSAPLSLACLPPTFPLAHQLSVFCLPSYPPPLFISPVHLPPPVLLAIS
eukprot:4025380-Pleurochrysis_carterae.AAC.2